MEQIKVTVQTEKRLEAIRNLAIAIKEVAQALSVGTHVEISNCRFVGNNDHPAIYIATEEEVTETKIERCEE